MRITPAIAREFAAKSHESRRLRSAITAGQPIAQPQIAESCEDDYRKQRLARVRKQLDRVDKLMMTEDDPARLDRLASAQTRLSEQERVLDGRPTPGQLRPGSKDDKRRNRQPQVQSAPEPDDTPPQLDKPAL